MILIFNWFISSLGSILSALLLLLPDSPFNAILNIDNRFIKAINYILPISSAVAHLTAFAAAVVVYYAIRVMLKWIKAAGS